MFPAPCGKPSPEPPAEQRRRQDCIRALAEGREIAYPDEDLRHAILRFPLAPQCCFEVEVYGSGLNPPLEVVDQRARREGIAGSPFAEPAESHLVRDAAGARPQARRDRTVEYTRSGCPAWRFTTKRTTEKELRRARW